MSENYIPHSPVRKSLRGPVESRGVETRDKKVPKRRVVVKSIALGKQMGSLGVSGLAAINRELISRELKTAPETKSCDSMDEKIVAGC